MDRKNKRNFTIRKDYLENKITGSLVHKVYNSPESNYGGQPSAAIFDEINNYQDDRNMEAIQTGMSLSEDKPIQLMAANPPEDKIHFVMNLLAECRKDTDFFVKDFSAPKNADWLLPETWALANPFIKEYLRTKGKKFKNVFEFYKKQAALAEKNKGKEISFRRLLLGQGVKSSDLEWFDVTLIQTADNSVFRNKNLRWVTGIDLSATRDFSALSLCGYDNDTEHLYIKPFLYLPNLKNRRKIQSKMFLDWEAKGFLKIQRSDVTNKEQIVNDFKEFRKKHNLKIEATMFDPALASHYYEDFKPYNPKTVYYSGRQMTGAIREVERIGLAKKLFLIGENPCVRWQFNNCIVSQKSKGYCLLNRAISENNIDCPVSVTLAMKYLVDNPKKSYSSFYV